MHDSFHTVNTSLVRSSLLEHSGKLIAKSQEKNDGNLVSGNLRVSFLDGLRVSENKLDNRLRLMLQVVDNDRTYTFSKKYLLDSSISEAHERLRDGVYGALVERLIRDAAEDPA